LIDERLAMLRSGEAFGANVTVPHKQAFFAAVDSVSGGAQRAGAVNTIVARDGQLAGHNTDIHGFAAPLIERAFPFQTSQVVVLGAGGAARGVLVALLECNSAEIIVVNRTLARAEDIVRVIADDRVTAAPLADAVAAARGAALIVNATSIGWDDSAPPVAPVVFAALSPSAIAYDLTYRDTAFLRAASEHGVAILDGLEMLVHQGAKSFELWTGIAPPIDLMLSAARAARGRAVG
jgi:shikimate dehydrogenase